MKRAAPLVLVLMLLINCFTPVKEQVVPSQPSITEVPPTHPPEPLPTSEPTSEIVSSPRETPEPVMIPPFNPGQALSQIAPRFRAPEYPIDQQGGLLYLSHDLDGDGRLEVLMPGLESEDPEAATFENLSDFSRLYDNKEEKHSFFLYVFRDVGGGYRLLNKLALGERLVFKSFTRFYANPTRKDPVIFDITFQTREGTAHEWVIFRKGSLFPASTQHFSETVSRQVQIEDIDADGTLDIVIQEKNMEERMGFESYLLWRRWNGLQFVEYKSTNVVRNLNLFLKQVRELVIAGDIRELLLFAVGPEVLKEQAARGYEKILLDFMGITLYHSEDEVPEEELLSCIRDVVFPEIMDTPFYLNDKKGSWCPLTFRVEYQDNFSLVSEASLYMLKNPFGARQFLFRQIKE